MSNPTTPFSWQMPTATDLVTDLPADFEVFGQAVATSMADLLGGTSGQILAKNSNTDMDFVWIANDQGDITGITATAPLTGGGSSGAVTVGIQDALTTQKGAVQLSDSTSTTSSILAATPTAVKAAYDLADGAIAKTTVTTAGDIIYRNATVPVRLGIGTAGQVLTVNSGATAPQWSTPSAGSSISIAAFSDQKTSGTNGGTFTSGAFRTRDINTTVGTNGITGCSIASNQITLPAGTFLIQGSAPAYDVNNHVTRFYNITDSTVAINGGTSYVDATDIAVTHSPFSGVVVIAGSKVFEVQHYAAATTATYGFGISTGFTAEVYAQITIIKVA